jgi:pilus assembly protein CpaC
LIGAGGTTGALINAGNETFKVGIIDSGNSFFGLVRALRENKLAKVLADPTVVAIDGRPASFNSGGEFPILVPAGLGQVGIEFREFGTRVDFVAKVRGDGRIWLEVRPMVSEIDPGRSLNIQGTSVPGLRSRFVDTSVELRAGQTLALAGLLQVRTEAESVGIVGLADIPYLGALFRSNREVQNEVELLILVTPNFAAPMDPHEVPAGGPGYNSDSPLDKELYLHGHIEVPATCGPAGVTLSETHASGPALYGSAFPPGADNFSPSSVTNKSRVPAQPVSTAKPVPLPVRR